MEFVKRVPPSIPAEAASSDLLGRKPTGSAYDEIRPPIFAGASGATPTDAVYGVVTPQKSHIVRNVVLIVVPVFILLGMGFLCFMMSWMGNSPPTKFAIQTAERSAFVQQRIGTPLKASFWISGEINVNGKSHGFAELTIPVTGPHGKGELYAKEWFSDEGWKVAFLSYSDKSGSKVIQSEF